MTTTTRGGSDSEGASDIRGVARSPCCRAEWRAPVTVTDAPREAICSRCRRPWMAHAWAAYSAGEYRRLTGEGVPPEEL